MKTFRVFYDNYCILFGDNRFSVVVEAVTAENAISKVIFMKREYAIGNFEVWELKGE